MSDPFYEYKNRLAEIRQQYPVLHRFGDNWALEIYRQIQEGQLNEFVLSTVPTQKTVETLFKRFSNTRAGVSSFGDINIALEPANVWDIEKVIEFMDGFGWYPATVGQESYTQDRLDKAVISIAKRQEQLIMISFEKKYDEKQDLEPFYYHITSDVYANEIDKIGLVAKSHSKISTHPSRIYLLNPTPIDDIVDTAQALFNTTKPEVKDKTNHLVIYRIDPSKVNNLEVFEDPNFLMGNGAVWTQKNIPPSAMKKVVSLQIDKS